MNVCECTTPCKLSRSTAPSESRNGKTSLAADHMEACPGFQPPAAVLRELPDYCAWPKRCLPAILPEYKRQEVIAAWTIRLYQEHGAATPCDVNRGDRPYRVLFLHIQD